MRVLCGAMNNFFDFSGGGFFGAGTEPTRAVLVDGHLGPEGSDGQVTDAGARDLVALPPLNTPITLAVGAACPAAGQEHAGGGADSGGVAGGGGGVAAGVTDHGRGALAVVEATNDATGGPEKDLCLGETADIGDVGCRPIAGAHGKVAMAAITGCTIAMPVAGTTLHEVGGVLLSGGGADCVGRGAGGDVGVDGGVGAGGKAGGGAGGDTVGDAGGDAGGSAGGDAGGGPGGTADGDGDSWGGGSDVGGHDGAGENDAGNDAEHDGAADNVDASDKRRSQPSDIQEYSR